MQVKGIHHCSVLVANTKRALEFYRGVLGLKIDNSRPDLGYPGAWLETGDQQIHLLELKNEGAGYHDEHGGRDRHIALMIDKLDSLRRALEKEGIDYTMSRSGRQALFCRDPDGNALEFIASM